jgi:hypothetical protein
MNALQAYLLNEPIICAIGGETGSGKTLSVLRALDHAYVITPQATNLLAAVHDMGVTDIVPRTQFTGKESFVFDVAVDIEFRPPAAEQATGRGLLNYLSIDANGNPRYIPKGFTNVLIDDISDMSKVSKADALQSDMYNTKAGVFNVQAMYGDLMEGNDAVKAAILKLASKGISVWITGHLAEPQMSQDRKQVLSKPRSVSIKMGSQNQAKELSTVYRIFLATEPDDAAEGWPFKFVCRQKRPTHYLAKDVFGIFQEEGPMNIREALLRVGRNMPRHKNLKALDAWVDACVTMIEQGSNRSDILEWLHAQKALSPNRCNLVTDDAVARHFYKQVSVS